MVLNNNIHFVMDINNNTINIITIELYIFDELFDLFIFINMDIIIIAMTIDIIHVCVILISTLLISSINLVIHLFCINGHGCDSSSVDKVCVCVLCSTFIWRLVAKQLIN